MRYFSSGAIRGFSGAALGFSGAIGLVILCLASISGAEGRAAETSIETPAKKSIGPVTGLELPRYVSLKARKANVRRGPGRGHRVDWVFVRRGMPLQVTAEYENWRRVRDKDGAGGWMHYSLLTGHRTAIVLSDRTALREAPATGARLAAWLEQGVIVSLDGCAALWCEGEADGIDGWTPKAGLWGVDPGEVFE